METRSVRPASLQIDEAFLEQFNAMLRGWDYDDEKGREALRILLHLFSRIRIEPYEKPGSGIGWALTVDDRQEPEL